MGQAKRRKQALGDLYGTPEGSNSRGKRTAARQSPDTFKRFTERQVTSMLSEQDSIELMNLCKLPGPWQRRYIPEVTDEVKEIIFTCEQDMVWTLIIPANYQECASKKGPIAWMDPYTIKNMLGD